MALHAWNMHTHLERSGQLASDFFAVAWAGCTASRSAASFQKLLLTLHIDFIDACWFIFCLLEFLLMTYAFYYHFQLEDIHLKEYSKWIDVLDFHWRLGIDGLSVGYHD